MPGTGGPTIACETNVPVISLGVASASWHFGGGGQKWCVSLRLRRKERGDPRRVGPVHLARPERERTGASIFCKSRSWRLLVWLGVLTPRGRGASPRSA